jgi:hypothetical protein
VTIPKQIDTMSICISTLVSSCEIFVCKMPNRFLFASSITCLPCNFISVMITHCDIIPHIRAQYHSDPFGIGVHDKSHPSR